MGETDEFALKAATAGEIPMIVKEPRQLIGLADAIIIDHRHAKHHLPAAEVFLKARLPMFIDKPFCYRLAEGKRFCDKAARLGVPIVSFSSVPLHRQARQFIAEVRKTPVVSVSSVGPCDLNSPYGGIFFYGIHQVDMLLEAFGLDVEAVHMSCRKGSDRATATLWWAGGLMGTVHCVAGAKTGFAFLASTDNGPIARKIQSDPNPYLTGIKMFCRMFKTGVQPLPMQRFLAPVAVLEALEKSLASGKTEKVAKV